MTDYSSEDYVETVAQSCRNFGLTGNVGSRHSAIAEGLSCRSCKNWSGSRCMINSFDNVLNRIE